MLTLSTDPRNDNATGGRQEQAAPAIPLSTEPWPGAVEMILSALDAAHSAAIERREGQRMSYRVRAALKLFSDMSDTRPWELYTRDVSPRGLGFITPHCLPLGYGGHVDLLAPNGEMITAACTLLRCREAAPGWFEGALYFNRRQPQFETG